MEYPKSIRTICDNCGTLITTVTDFLIATDGKVAYQGCICPKCGGVLIFDNLVVRLTVLPKKSRVHKGKKTKKDKKKKWKIINKGKLIVKDENTTRQPTKPRKAKKAV